MLHPSFPFLSSTLLSTALKGAAAEGSLDGSLQTHWRHLVRQSSTCLCSLCFCNGCPTHLLTDSVFCRVSIFNQCYGSKRYWRSADIYEQKLTIYITLQMLYTVNMLNRFNAISLSILQSISVFFIIFLLLSRCLPVGLGRQGECISNSSPFLFSSPGVISNNCSSRHYPPICS